MESYQTQSKKVIPKLKPQRTKNTITIAKKYGQLNNGLKDWHSFHVLYRKKYKENEVSTAFENSQRFVLENNQFRINATPPLFGENRITSSALASNNNALFPKWSFSFSTEKPIFKKNIVGYKFTNDVIDTNSFSYARYFGSLMPKITGNITAVNNRYITFGNHRYVRGVIVPYIFKSVLCCYTFYCCTY